ASQIMRASLAAGAERTGGLAADPRPTPFISVVVPARNEAPVIGDVVADLVVQRYGPPERPAFEVVVLDDDSDDGTGALAAEAAANAGAPEGLFRLLPRELIAGTRTKGAALARAMPHLRGTTVAVVDADARVGPDFLAGVVAAWSRDPTHALGRGKPAPPHGARTATDPRYSAPGPQAGLPGLHRRIPDPTALRGQHHRQPDHHPVADPHGLDDPHLAHRRLRARLVRARARGSCGRGRAWWGAAGPFIARGALPLPLVGGGPNGAGEDRDRSRDDHLRQDATH